MASSKVVLITGCSTGIGHATAELLAGAGWTVYATARKPETLTDLEAKGCKTLALDVDSEESMTAAVSAVEAAEGSIYALVNNAGWSQNGAVETVPIERVRRQFETNVFGLVRMTQLVLPGMRRAGEGRIVNVSSMGGKIVFPGGGYYHATKHAVEAISDALRFEVAAFGIQVVVIEPGLIKTQFGETSVASVDANADGDDVYGEFNKGVADATAGAYDGFTGKRLGGGPETVARAIQKAVESGRPKTRYRVTPSAKILMTQRRLVSDRIWDRAMRGQFPRPGAS
jgi:NAD(P)-dependent dehydrogenase (short-subunit alcohol dehydrogenase family)